MYFLNNIFCVGAAYVKSKVFQRTNYRIKYFVAYFFFLLQSDTDPFNKFKAMSEVIMSH